MLTARCREPRPSQFSLRLQVRVISTSNIYLFIQTVPTELLVPYKLLVLFIAPVPEPEAPHQGVRAIAEQADRCTWKFRTV